MAPGIPLLPMHEVAFALDVIRQGDWLSIRGMLFIKAMRYGWSDLPFQEAIVDPTTGDNAYHVGAGTGQVDVIEQLHMAFFHKCPRRDDLPRQAIAKTNLAGETPLHFAARSGSVDATWMVYSWFCYRLKVCSGQELRQHIAKVTAEPLEEHDWIYRLSYLVHKNTSGMNAADVARAAGHERVALFLEQLVAFLDPDNRRAEETGILADNIRELNLGPFEKRPFAPPVFTLLSDHGRVDVNVITPRASFNVNEVEVDTEV